MSKLSIKELEEYLKSSDLEKLFAKMPPKSENVSFLTLMSRLTGRAGSRDEFRDLALKFKKNKKFSSTLREKVELLLLFCDLEDAEADKDEQQRKKLIALLNKKFLKFNFKFRRPKQVETNNAALRNEEEDLRKEEEEKELLSKHLQVVSRLKESQTMDDLNTVDGYFFLQNFDLDKFDLKKMKPIVFNKVVSMVLSKNGFLYPNFQSFLNRLVKLPETLFKQHMSKFLNILQTVPAEWLEDFKENAYFKDNEQFFRIYLQKVFELHSLTLKGVKLEKLLDIQKFVETLGGKFNPTKRTLSFLILQKQVEKQIFNADKLKEYLEDPLLSRTTQDRTRFPKKENDEEIFDLKPISNVGRRMYQKPVRQMMYQAPVQEMRYQEPVQQMMYQQPVQQMRYERPMQKSSKSNRNRKRHRGNANLVSIPSSKEHGEMIDAHLKHFFQGDQKPSDWTSFFNENFLKKLYFNERLLKGELPEGFDEALSEIEVKNLTEKKTLRFLKSNKERFNRGQAVNLKLQLKNIKELKVKIFQINIESALLENQNIDFSKMDLLGLVARDELSFTFSEPPLRQWTESFQFDSIDTSERGVFIIDFITGRLSSRAVIYKGGLGLIYRKEKLGTTAWVLDEDRNICKGPRTGLYIKKKFFAVDKKGQIKVPYNTPDFSENVIACHDHFAIKAKLQLSKPTFKTNLQLLFNSEQLRSGNEVDFLLLPDLTMSNGPLDLSTLINPSVSCTISSSLGDVKKIDIKGKDLKLEAGKFLKCSFVFPPKTIVIQFNFTAKVKLLGEEEATLSGSKYLNFMPQEERTLEQVYLTANKVSPLESDNENTCPPGAESDFTVQVRGRDGELRKNKEFSLNIRTLGLTSATRSGNLQTKADGYKNIGSLSWMNDISVNLPSHINAPKTFVEATKTEYSKKILMTENDWLSIPVADPSRNYLFRVLGSDKNINLGMGIGSSNIIEDLSSNEKVMVAKGPHTLEIRGLKQGNYALVLRLPDGIRVIPMMIQVISGERFELGGLDFIEWNSQFVQLENKTAFYMLHTPENSDEPQLLSGGLRIGNKSKFEEDKNEPHTESSQRSKVEGVLICSSFLNHEGAGLRKINASGLHQAVVHSRYAKGLKKNEYFSNKLMDEEIIYVLRRKGLPEFMGNTLDKPTMLIRREKARGTATENLQLQKEGEYNQKRAAYDDILGGGMRMKNRADMNHDTMDLSYDFLKRPGTIVTEITFNEDGVPVIPKDVLEKYNYVEMIVNVSGEVILRQMIKQTWSEPEKETLVLESSKKKGFVYRNIRIIKPVTANKSYTIQNVANTTFWNVDTLGELAKSQEILCRGLSSSLQEWKFLSRWNEMRPSEKLKTYDKFYSHELNIFVRFKDREFFDEVVAPFIANKRDRSFIDLFLLDEKEAAREYLGTVRMSRLNNIERVLLFLMFFEDEKAHGIVEDFNGTATLPHNRRGDEEFKSLFENLLNSRKENENEEGGASSSIPPMPGRVRPPGAYMNRAPMLIAQRCRVPPRPMQMQRKRSFTRRRSFVQNDMSFSDYGSDDEECEEEEECDYEEDESESYSSDSEDGFQMAGAKVYTPMAATAEYVEKQYYSNQLPSLTDNVFYFNLTEHILKKGGSTKDFVDKNFIFCTASLTECIFVLSVSDLPFKKSDISRKLEKNKLKITPSSNCLLFSKEISEVKGSAADVDFLVSQRFYDPEDRFFHMDNGTKREKPVKEFIIGRVYGCRIVVTNSTVSDHQVSVITEIPSGSIALRPGDSLKVSPLTVKSFMSQVIDITFYFPSPGTFKIYPATVAKEDQIFATASDTQEIKVKSKKTQRALESISDVLSAGNMTDIVEFLRARNLRDSNVFQFENIGWLMKNPDFYNQVLPILRDKGLFLESAWKFSVLHGDSAALKELLTNPFYKGIFKNINYLKNSYLNIDRSEAKDYFPIANPRAHSVGENRENIANKQFRTTYKNFLMYLVEKGTPSTEDWVLWVTYLLLQDRVFEANQMFSELGKEARENVQTRIQCDYIEAYVDFMTGFPKFEKAKALCREYLDYPVLAWRNLFVEIANQLSEYEETGIEAGDPEAKAKAKKGNVANADKSPYLSAEIVKDQAKVSFRNQKKLHLEFYRIDLEVLFTQDPFETKLNSSLTNVLPFLRESHSVESKSDFQVVHYDIPTALRSENLLLRVVDDSKQTALLKYIPFRLEAVLSQEFGILKLIDQATNRPMPKVYVKCFARMPGNQIRFFKDGYTDLRGSFDYASMNTSGATKADKFRLLVTSSQFGAKILEADPPVGSRSQKGKAKKIKSKKYRGMRMKKGMIQKKYQLSDYSMDEMD